MPKELRGFSDCQTVLDRRVFQEKTPRPFVHQSSKIACLLNRTSEILAPQSCRIRNFTDDHRGWKRKASTFTTSSCDVGGVMVHLCFAPSPHPPAIANAGSTNKSLFGCTNPNRNGMPKKGLVCLPRGCMNLLKLVCGFRIVSLHIRKT